MKATLESKINGGAPVLICPRCGFWASYAKDPVIPHKLDIDAFPCPDCKHPLDSVESR